MIGDGRGQVGGGTEQPPMAAMDGWMDGGEDEVDAVRHATDARTSSA